MMNNPIFKFRFNIKKRNAYYKKMKQQPSKRKQQFIRGLKTNSLLIIFIALLIAGGIILSLEHFVLSGGVLETKDYISATPKDYFAQVSYLVYDDKTKGSDVKRVYYFGGSSAYCMLDYRHFRESLAAYDEDYLFVPIAAPGTSTEQAIVILENLPKSDSVVILTSYYRKMTTKHTSNNLLLKIPSDTCWLGADDYAGDPSYHFVSGRFMRILWERIFLAYRPSYIFSPFPLADVENYTNELKIFKYSEAEYELVMSRNRKGLVNRDNDDDIANYRRLLVDIIEVCEEKGFTLIIEEAPLNIEGIGEDSVFEADSLYMTHISMMASLAQSYDHVYYKNAPSSAGLTADVFADEIHLNPVNGVRERVSDLVLEDLSEVLDQEID